MKSKSIPLSSGSFPRSSRLLSSEQNSSPHEPRFGHNDRIVHFPSVLHHPQAKEAFNDLQEAQVEATEPHL